ncbi:MAG: carbohydrate porin [Hyphomicrobium sp.]
MTSVSVLAQVLTAAALGAEDEAPPPPSIARSLRLPDGRAGLKAAGVDLSYAYIGEYFNVVSGGVSHGSSFNGRLEQTLYLDLDKLAGWRGSTLHAHAFAIHGRGASVSHLADAATVSNIEALETVRLFELWMEQALFDGRVTIRFGQLAADSEFFISETAAQFFNGTFGWPGTTAANMTQGGPAYPLATPGVRVLVKPVDHITVLAAIYNGSPADPEAEDAQRDNRHGLDFRLGDPPLVMAEGQVRYTSGLLGGLPGTFKLGGWHEFATFSDKLTGAEIEGNGGIYAVIDQGLWTEAAGGAINFLARVSGTPRRQNEIDFYADAGLVFTGFVPGRPADTIGLAAGYGHVSPRVSARQIADQAAVISDFEAVIEVNYSAEIVPGWTIAPDFHYLWHPGGGTENPAKPGRAIEDTAIVGVRTNVVY